MKTLSLRDLRLQMGLTQAQLANKIGTHYQTISNAEGGRAPLPARHFLAISKLFKVSVDDMIDAAVDRYRERLTTKLKRKTKQTYSF